MAYCGKCGSPLAEGQEFCGVCGQPAGGARPSGPPPYPPEAYGPRPSRRGGAGLWIALVSLVVVVAVACVLVFAVFKDDIFAGGAAGTPEGTVNRVLDAIQSEDVDAFFALLDPETMDQFLSGQSLDEAKKDLAGTMFAEGSVKFSGVKMSTKETGDTTATVTVTGGTVTMTGADGEQVTKGVTEADEPVEFDLVKRDGSWYVDAGSTFFSGTLGGGDGGGADTTSTTGTTTVTSTEVTTATTTATTDVIITTTSGVTPTTSAAGGAATPEEAVFLLFQAMEDKDIDLLFALFDPVALEEQLGGLSLKDAKDDLFEEMFYYEAVDFSGIELSTLNTSTTTATVTVIAGTVTWTDVGAAPETEDVKDADAPVTFEVIKRGAYWYLDPEAMF